MKIKDMTRLLFAAGAVLAYASSFGHEACARESFDLPRAEFAKYYREITGKDAPAEIVKFAIDPKVSKSGRDAYRIVTTASVQQQGVTITGSNVRSVWYGLYDLLERRGGCHWFWDGDVVPKRDTIDLSNLDVYEEARFEYRGLRYFAHRGLTRFQAEHWGPEDWKKEIDWILKRRLNVFMLRIGQDDLFQRTFPDACAYPDPSKPQPGAGTGYNDRSLFWSLQFRGKLRDDLQKYGFERGLMVPEDYGTMTHWYAPTPLDYIENRKPPFYPGADKRPVNNRVWDVRDDRWIDEYWKMTKTAVETYGKGAPEPRLLHTIGTGERILSKDKKENFKLKVLGLQHFMSRVERDYPDAKLLMPGWDFYFSWSPQEVKDFLKLLDPKKCIVWDYSADQKTGRGAKSNFTKWDVIGKFPYTYSVFLAYEKALDARADYPIIEERQKLVQNDPFCKGFIFWPESSHTDTLLLRYFTANAWSDKAIPHGEVLDEFCASRYGKNAEAMKEAWKAALPASWLRDWTTTYGDVILKGDFGDKKATRAPKKWRKPVADAEKVFGMLAEMEWKDDFIKRDTIDIARMVLDRVICLYRADLSADVAKWRKGAASVQQQEALVARARKIAALCDLMADILALHTDYSLWESYQRLDAVEKIQNPDFSKTLFENASCGYCRSHQYELARHWYAPHFRKIAENLAKAVADGNREATLSPPTEPERLALKEKPLESLKPTLPRTEENYRKILRKIEGLLDMSPKPFDLPRNEFAKYYKQITGKDAPDGIVQFVIDPKVSKSGRDAYRIVTTASVQQQVVTITGSNLRSVWYGLYDLLERRGGCHWFWDGDVVPKRDTIDLSNLDVHEEARFEYRGLRYFAHRGLTRFQAEHWGPEDWKKEIDWLLKRRLNVFMLRIGQDDLFQRTFPDTCAYPDPAKPLPGVGHSHDDRTLFWSLQYRGELRDNLQKYAFERGLMVPEDFGTMTHWYSRTPEDFLAKKKPEFIPLANKGENYHVPNSQVWNIRDDKWVDEYWKMTKTAVETYGNGAPAPQLLHTIGLGERMCYKDRKKNFDMKILALDKFLAKAHTDYPDAKVLIAGWDFYSTWRPNEVKALLPRLDPKRDIIWDYEGDVTPLGHKNNFTNWGLVGKFPYTFSIFLAYENGLDARANYPLIEARQKVVQDDPFCKGYILWPESSHTDTLGLRFFTANAWAANPVPYGDVLDEFCASRYGANAERMKAAWKVALPASWLRGWGGNYARYMVGLGFDAGAAPGTIKKWSGPVKEAEAVFGMLAEAPWEDEFVRRDAIDIARMVLDRVIALRTQELCRDIAAWRKNGRGDGLVAQAKMIVALNEKMADLLALHTDYSLWETYQRMDAIEKIRNPEFSKTLFENASCPYCRSHQYELVRYWYAPHVRKMTERLAKAVASGDRKAKFSEGAEQERLALKARPLESLKPTLPRTQANFRKVMREIASVLAVYPVVAEGNMDLYLLIGQSNMAGRGKLTADNRVDTDRVFKLDAKGQWQIADEPIHFDKKVAGAGLAASFARTMADIDKNVKVGLIPCAVGGTGIDRWVESGDLWSNAVARARIALKSGTLKGILWHQGEHDATPKGVSAWSAKMEFMVKSFRREFGDVPFIAGELGWYLKDFRGKGGSTLLWREINAQLHALEGKVPNFRVASAEGLGANRDKLHFNIEALREFGRRYAAVFLELEDTEQKKAFAMQRAEFAKYYREITGKDAPDGIVRFAIDSKISNGGRDAYRIMTTASGQQQGVTITGSNLRSVWYGLYDLLERRGGCHWFWDGDVVPKRDSIDLSNLNIHEEAHFEYRAIRYFAHRGLTRFQAEHWGLDDWKKEIDWILKRRLNTFMLRIGQDDVFQRAFPDVCPYPDASKPQPGMYNGYNDRTLFWSLQFRGQLRHDLQKYAFDRGLMSPEDFGTMSHWYSPTPDSYLANKKPPFLPQANSTHAEPHLRVWDIREGNWAEEYWKLTKTAIDAYDQGAPEPRLLHTIGLGERWCYKDRKANFDLKVKTLNKFLDMAKRDYPDAKLLIAGWDFYSTWKNEEVREYLKTLDKDSVLLWDYEADDAKRGAKARNFTNWDVIGKFPYTYSIFLAYEKALDTRANYEIIEERQKLVQNDPFCKGYILWPESSHTDTLLLRFFTANAWADKLVPHGDVLDEFCANRYGASAETMKAAWKAALPASWLRDWGNNYSYAVLGIGGNPPPVKLIDKWKQPVEDAQKVFTLLQQVPWDDPFVQRDAIDIARMVLDRLIAVRVWEFGRELGAWRTNTTASVQQQDVLLAKINRVAELCDAMADLLALHTDYSLWESYQRLDAVEKIRNPAFEKTLFENASCDYCRSHQYELARHWYAPHVKAVAEKLAKAVAAGDHNAEITVNAEKERLALKARPLESLKPTTPRTAENFHKVLREVEGLKGKNN